MLRIMWIRFLRSYVKSVQRRAEVRSGAFLVGDIQKSDEEEYVYIYGAIQMHELKMEGNEYVIDEATWKNAYEDWQAVF